jgi:hypothetical protein
MAESKEHNWAGLTARTATLLKAPKIPPVPQEIVDLAQRSFDGVKDGEGEDAEVNHVLAHEFKSEEMAAEFAKHMKNAGHHTTPKSSVSVAVDPMDTGNKKLVHWKAGTRRGRAAS